MTPSAEKSSKTFAKNFRKFLVALVAGFVPVAAAAQQVAPRDWQASAWNLVEPWEANSRTFAHGEVRLALLNTIEPAAGSYHILVLSPPYGVLGDRRCRAIGMRLGVGFSSADFAALDAAFDPAVGLIFTLPVSRCLPDTADLAPAPVRFTLNQATGAIDPELRPVFP